MYFATLARWTKAREKFVFERKRRGRSRARGGVDGSGDAQTRQWRRRIGRNRGGFEKDAQEKMSRTVRLEEEKADRQRRSTDRCSLRRDWE